MGREDHVSVKLLVPKDLAHLHDDLLDPLDLLPHAPAYRQLQPQQLSDSEG